MKNHVPSPKLFKTLQEAGNWGKVVNVRTVGALNEIVANGGASNLILVQEALQEKKIAQIAEKIAGDARHFPNLLYDVLWHGSSRCCAG